VKADGRLKIDSRRQRILDQLARDGQVRVSQLAETLGTTQVTIRSDLSALERDGFLEKIVGGALQTVKNFYNMELMQRRQHNAENKRAIAASAAALVNDGETLFINSGTTTLFTAMELKRRRHLNVVTNSLAVAMELGTASTFRVQLLGGEINVQYAFTYGTSALEQLRLFKADKTFLSVDGVRADAGFSTYHAEEAAINRAMMERSRQTIIVADSSKLGHESFSFIANLSSAAVWVTNEGGDSDALREVENAGLKIIKSVTQPV